MAAARGIDEIYPTAATLAVALNATNVGLAALGQVQRHQPVWARARRA